jgi:mannose-6-phosphate isomerase-like protein (cupin superfamily)
MATRPGTIKADVETGGMPIAVTAGQAILRSEKREIGILVARKEVTITHARYSAGEQIAGPHVHHEHTDAFYVLEGELTFELGREAERVRVSSGGFVAVPPGLAHSFRNDGDHPARWLTIHAHDGGFAAFMRGARDGVEVEWDISEVPAEGGLAPSDAIVSPEVGDERLESGSRGSRLRCALPDLCVVEWHLDGPHADLPLHDQDGRVDSFFVIEGELEAVLAGTRQTVGPDTLISIPRGAERSLDFCGSGHARILSLHTPDTGFADHLRCGLSSS